MRMMKRSQVKITVTFRAILNAPLISSWDEFCARYSINEWCIKEGLVEGTDETQISLQDAERWGLIDREDD